MGITRGGRELNENLIDTLKREFLEETGFKIMKLDENPIHHINTKFYADDLNVFFNSDLYFFVIKELGKQDVSLINKSEIVEINSLPINTLNMNNINNVHLESIYRISI